MTMLRMVMRLVGMVWIPASGMRIPSELKTFDQQLRGSCQVVDWWW